MCLTWPFFRVLREDPVAPYEIMELPLDNCYCGESESLIFELDSRLPPDHMKIEEAARGESVESKINFSRKKDSRGVFQVLIANCSRKVKCL